MAKVKPIVRTSAGLRDALFDEIDGLRNGESNHRQALVVAKLACQVINSVKAEIEFHSYVRGLNAGDEVPLQQTLKLGGAPPAA